MKNKLFTLAAALTLAAVIGSIYAAPALAAAVKAALVQNVDEPGRHPIIWNFQGHNSADLPTVLAGQRVVTQQISIIMFAGNANQVSVITYDAGNSNDFARNEYLMTDQTGAGTGQEVTAPMIGYVDAGKHLTISPWSNTNEQNYRGTITGYVIDCSTPGSCQ